MIKIPKILGLTLLLVINANGESEFLPSAIRGSCEFVLKLSAGLSLLNGVGHVSRMAQLHERWIERVWVRI